jgi:type IV secretion system protein TrbL
MNTGVIDQFLNTFATYIDSGFGLLNGEVAFLATTLVAIDITLAALFWAWGNEDILAGLVKKTLYVGFFALLIGNWNNFAQIIFNSFSGLGLKAAGSALSAAQFLQPGRIAQVGIDAGLPILQSASSLVGFTAIINPMIWLEMGVLLTAFLVVLGSFFVLAIQLFVTLIEFKLTTLAGFVLVPFGLFGPTAFLAERVLGNVVASGIKILVLAVIIGIGTNLFSQFTQGQGFGGNQPSLQNVLAIMLAALSLLGLGIYGPGIATGLAAGAPQLGAGAAIGTVSTAWNAITVGRSLAGQGGEFLAANRSARWAAVTPGGGSGGGPSGGSPSGGGRSGGGGGPPNGGGPPAWAQRMQRQQARNQGLGAVGRALRAGGSGGASTSVPLKPPSP